MNLTLQKFAKEKRYLTHITLYPKPFPIEKRWVKPIDGDLSAL